MIENSMLIALYVTAIAIFCIGSSRLPILSEEAQHRVSSLDGLRGILATAVLVHHFTVSYYWHTTSLWEMTQSPVINNFGAVPVSLFFMITGYLFGSKIYKGTPEWGAVLSSRIRRIFPMYLFSVTLIIAITFYQTRGTMEPLTETFNAIGHWMIFIGVPINGFEETSRINAVVHWTLLYEAVFYLSLPFLYCVLRHRLPGAAVLVSLIALAVLWPLYGSHFSTRYIKLFAVGICVAVFEDRLKKKTINYSGILSTVIALAVLAICMNLKPYSKGQMIFLSVPFTLFVLGNSLNGLLENRGLKILGEASFSIYLMHGIVIYTLFSVFSVYDFSSGNFVSYAWYLPAVILLVSSLSVATYWGIERPFIRSRKRPMIQVSAA